jgi:hypothetical protein
VPQPAAAVARPKQLSERDLTFKQGYALRQAALGRSATAKAAPQPEAAPAPQPSRKKVAQAKPKASKQRPHMQAYQLPDGRVVMVRRGYRSQPDPRVAEGGFRSAEMRSERFGFFGEPFPPRRSLFGSLF